VLEKHANSDEEQKNGDERQNIEQRVAPELMRLESSRQQSTNARLLKYYSRAG
jgi:hypothetical protein